MADSSNASNTNTGNHIHLLSAFLDEHAPRAGGFDSTRHIGLPPPLRHQHAEAEASMHGQQQQQQQSGRTSPRFNRTFSDPGFSLAASASEAQRKAWSDPFTDFETMTPDTTSQFSLSTIAELLRDSSLMGVDDLTFTTEDPFGLEATALPPPLPGWATELPAITENGQSSIWTPPNVKEELPTRPGTQKLKAESRRSGSKQTRSQGSLSDTELLDMVSSPPSAQPAPYFRGPSTSALPRPAHAHEQAQGWRSSPRDVLNNSWTTGSTGKMTRQRSFQTRSRTIPLFHPNRIGKPGLSTALRGYVNPADLIPAPRERSSTYRGVTKHRRSGRWEAYIWIPAAGKQMYLGGFETEECAAEAYDIVAIKHRGKEAVTNFNIEEYADMMDHIASADIKDLIVEVRTNSKGKLRKHGRGILHPRHYVTSRNSCTEDNAACVDSRRI
eukprot:jgi/Chlat1/711/Chrsp104S01294